MSGMIEKLRELLAGRPYDDECAGFVLAYGEELLKAIAWQSIETAPANVEVWLFDPDTDPQQYAAILVERECDEGGYYWRPAESLVAEAIDYELTPTHWMPLPEPPDALRYTITEAGRAMLAQQSSPERQQGE